MISRDDIVASARDLIGTPWRHQGRTRAGLDCVGMVVLICRERGLSDYDVAGYATDPNFDFLRHMTAGGGLPVPLTEAGPGDILALSEMARPCHVGIKSSRHGTDYVIHAHATRRKVLEEPLAAVLQNNRLVAAFRIPGVG